MIYGIRISFDLYHTVSQKKKSSIFNILVPQLTEMALCQKANTLQCLQHHL